MDRLSGNIRKKYNFEQAVGLQEALMLCDIEPDGRMHDGLDDAWNTARLIENWKRIQIISSFIGNGRSKKIHSH